MRRLWAVVVVGVFVPMAFLAASASAQTQSPSGDTCTAAGSGTTYTLHITIPGGAQQFGFAIGAPGAKVTDASIPGVNGNFSTKNLAPSTTGAWMSDSPLPSASVASLTISGTVTGSFRIVPANPSQPKYYDAVRCTVTRATPAPSISFTVDKNLSYSAAAGAWRMVVKIPGAGTVSAFQPEPTTGGPSAKPVTAKSLVQTRNAGLKSAGKVTLSLRPTPGGQTVLSKTGSIELKLRVTFYAQDGRSASKLVSLTLKK